MWRRLSTIIGATLAAVLTFTACSSSGKSGRYEHVVGRLHHRIDVGIWLAGA